MKRACYALNPKYKNQLNALGSALHNLGAMGTAHQTPWACGRVSTPGSALGGLPARMTVGAPHPAGEAPDTPEGQQGQGRGVCLQEARAQSQYSCLIGLDY